MNDSKIINLSSKSVALSIDVHSHNYSASQNSHNTELVNKDSSPNILYLNDNQPKLKNTSFIDFSVSSPIVHKLKCFLCNRDDHNDEGLACTQKHFFCKPCFLEFFLLYGVVQISLRCPVVTCCHKFNRYDLYALLNEHDLYEKANIVEDTAKNAIKHEESEFLINKKIVSSLVTASQDICKDCHFEAFVSLNRLNFKVCMNCQSNFCKYCSKPYCRSHLNIIKSEYCRVYNRIEGKLKSKNYFSDLIQVYLYLTSSLVFAICGLFCVLNAFSLSCLNTSLKKYILFLVVLIEVPIGFIIFFVFLPFWFCLRSMKVV